MLILFSVCASILFVSEYEDRIRLFVHDLLACVRCIARGEDL